MPFDLGRVTGTAYAISLCGSLALLFVSLTVIYARVPNRPVRWRAVWSGALGATVAIGVVDCAFPPYLTSISTIARFGTTIVFVLLLLGWCYGGVLALLSGATVTAIRLGVAPRPIATDGAFCATRREAWVTGLTAGPACCATGVTPPARWPRPNRPISVASGGAFVRLPFAQCGMRGGKA